MNVNKCNTMFVLFILYLSSVTHAINFVGSDYADKIVDIVKNTDGAQLAGFLKALKIEQVNILSRLRSHKKKCDDVLDKCKSKFSILQNCNSFNSFKKQQAESYLSSHHKELNETREFYVRLIQMVTHNHNDCKKIREYYEVEDKKLKKNKQVVESLQRVIKLRMVALKKAWHKAIVKENEAKAKRLEQQRIYGIARMEILRKTKNFKSKKPKSFTHRRDKEELKMKEKSVKLAKQMEKMKEQLKKAQLKKKNNIKDMSDGKSSMSIIEIHSKATEAIAEEEDNEINRNRSEMSLIQLKTQTVENKVMLILAKLEAQLKKFKTNFKKELDFLGKTKEELKVVYDSITKAVKTMADAEIKALEDCQSRLEIYANKKDKIQTMFVEGKIKEKVLKKNVEIEESRDKLCSLSISNTKLCNSMAQFCMEYQVEYNEEKNQIQDAIRLLKDFMVDSDA